MARLLIGNFKGIKGDKGEKGDDGVIDSNSIISFEDYTNSTPPPTDMALGSIKTGKSISSLLSNIKALLMSTLTTSKLANNLNTNQEGFALDARMGKQLGDSVGAINDTLTGLNSGAIRVTPPDVPSVPGSWATLYELQITKPGLYILIGHAGVINAPANTMAHIVWNHDGSKYTSFLASTNTTANQGEVVKITSVTAPITLKFQGWLPVSLTFGNLLVEAVCLKPY